MVLQTRKSVFAVVTESAENTPVAPSAATQFIAVQEGFSLAPGFSVLTNAEMKPTIGRSKDIKGLETPTFSMSHYMRSSGVEGTEAGFAPLLKCALGASSTTNTEYNTVSSSTTTVVNVDTGEGASYEAGEALLIKNTNGDAHEIRNIASIATDALTLAQALDNAPATGVNLGKAQLYKGVTDNSHPSLSMWAYIANGGATELMAGSKVSSLSISATAGEFVNASFSIDGSSFYYNPLEVTSSNEKIDFNEGAAEITATLPIRWYKDPYELAEAVEDAMNLVATATITVTYDDSTRKFTIASDGGTFQLTWAGGTNTASSAKTLLGFTSADDTGAVSYASDTALTFAASYTPNYDEAEPLVAKGNEVLFGTSTEVSCFDAKSVTFNLANTLADIPELCSESGSAGKIVGERVVSVDIVAYLSTGQAEEFKRYRKSDELIFTWNFGEKTAGNWVAGKTVNVHCPKVVINSFELADDGGVVVMNMSLMAFSDEGEAEVFVNTL